MKKTSVIVLKNCTLLKKNSSETVSTENQRNGLWENSLCLNSIKNNNHCDYMNILTSATRKQS